MSFTKSFALFLAGVFLFAALLSPAIKLGADLAREAQPGLAAALRLDPDDPTYDYGRVFRRTLMLVALAAGILFRRKIHWGAVLWAGSGHSRTGLFSAGWAVGVASLAALLVTLLLVGQRTPATTLAADWPGALGAAAVGALLVGLIEETFFRGLVLGGLLRDMPRAAAVLLGSAFYSGVHFLKAGLPVAGGWDPAVGIKALAAMGPALARREVLLPFIGLTLVGVLLSLAYVWTRSVLFAAGLHAGWVLMFKVDGIFLAPGPASSGGGMYGDQGTLASLTTWGFIVLTIVLLRLGVRRFLPGGS